MPMAHAAESTRHEAEDEWLSYSVSGADGDTRVYDSGVPGGGQLLSFFQQPDNGAATAKSRKLTITTEEPVVAARAASLDDGSMTPSADSNGDEALKVSTEDGKATVTLESTDEAQTIYLLPEQTPEAADPKDQNLLEKAWATVVGLIMGDDDSSSERESGAGENESDKSSKAQPTDAASSATSVDAGDSGEATSDDCDANTQPTATASTTKSQDSASSDRDPSSGPTGPATASSEDCAGSTVDDGTSGDSDDSSGEDSGSSNTGSEIQMENDASGLPFMLGAAGEGVANGEYAEALGRGVDIAATWANDNQNMVDLPQLQPGGEYGDWDKSLDISIGAIDQNSGETWSKAAAGLSPSLLVGVLVDEDFQRSASSGEAVVGMYGRHRAGEPDTRLVVVAVARHID
jgi:hypothetical protein